MSYSLFSIANFFISRMLLDKMLYEPTLFNLSLIMHLENAQKKYYQKYGKNLIQFPILGKNKDHPESYALALLYEDFCNDGPIIQWLRAGFTEEEFGQIMIECGLHQDVIPGYQYDDKFFDKQTRKFLKGIYKQLDTACRETLRQSNNKVIKLENRIRKVV